MPVSPVGTWHISSEEAHIAMSCSSPSNISFKDHFVEQSAPQREGTRTGGRWV